MRTKILRYAAGRDDKIVSVNEEVTFENEHMGWYVDAPDRNGHEEWDTIAVVMRADTIRFVPGFGNRQHVLQPEYINAITDEALHLRERIRKRIADEIWIPLLYVAAFLVLGWDTTPLVAHRERMQ